MRLVGPEEERVGSFCCNRRTKPFLARIRAMYFLLLTYCRDDDNTCAWSRFWMSGGATPLEWPFAASVSTGTVARFITFALLSAPRRALLSCAPHQVQDENPFGNVEKSWCWLSSRPAARRRIGGEKSEISQRKPGEGRPEVWL